MKLHYEFYIGASIEQVWDALLQPEYVKEIYMGSVLESSFEIGAPYAYVGPGKEGDRTVHVYGEILSMKPHQELSISHYTGKAYHPDSEKYESRITYGLEPVGQTVKLTLTHDQWNEQDPSYEASKGAWPMILSNTKTLIEQGKPLRFE